MENELKYEFILLFSVIIIKERDNLNAETFKQQKHIYYMTKNIFQWSMSLINDQDNQFNQDR
jgi:hypothetical protein